jgi:hypothetical protein
MARFPARRENGTRTYIEPTLTKSRSIMLVALLGAVVALAYFGVHPGSIQTTPPKITKQPVAFASHTFDPAAPPPPDMPPLNPGEAAECDTNFVAYASVAGRPQPIDATHETVTITHVDVTLELHINIWVPSNASQHILDHEEGHRQISEHYYETADQIAERIAASYTGKQVVISGSDLNAEFNKLLQQTSMNITDEYDKELNPEPVQLRYDAITNHALNDVVAADAVTQVIKDTTLASSQP